MNERQLTLARHFVKRLEAAGEFGDVWRFVQSEGQWARDDDREPDYDKVIDLVTSEFRQILVARVQGLPK